MRPTPADLDLLIATASAGSRCLARMKAVAAVADPDRPRGNPHGLPDGKPIARLMARTFRAAERETLAWLGTLDRPPGPGQVPTFEDLLGPTAEALGPLTLAYRLEAGRAILGALGADPDALEPDEDANRGRAEFAAASVLETLRGQIITALEIGPVEEKAGDDRRHGDSGRRDAGAGFAAPLHGGGTGVRVRPGRPEPQPDAEASPGSGSPDHPDSLRPAAQTKGLRDFARAAWDSLRGVFRRAIYGEPGTDTGVDEDAISRAQLIAETEASQAIHEASIEAGVFAGVTLEKVFAKAWRLDGRPCPICIANRDAGTVGLDDLFPSGQSSPPSHPNCKCSLVIVSLDD